MENQQFIYKQIKKFTGMLEENVQQLIKATKENLESFGHRNGGEVAFADKAKTAAEGTENRQTEGQTSLHINDVFTVPADDADFDACLISRKFSGDQTNPSIGLLVAVKRGGKDVIVQVFSSAFTRGQRKKGSDNKPEAQMSYPSGQPAEDVRNVQGNLYQALCALKGKTIKVTAEATPECWVIKRGAKVDPETGRFADADYEWRNTKMLGFTYVEA